jgi:broad specificity phosphatase PhoE
MAEEFLYIVLVGLPARGKSTTAFKLRESLRRDGVSAAIFNNGDLRRRLSEGNTSYPEFFDPQNQEGAALRERYATLNLNRAKAFVAKNRHKSRVAIIDAANVSPQRRDMLSGELPKDRMLFVECINNDGEILETNIQHKVETNEFARLPQEEATVMLKKRIQYYETIYVPLESERNFIQIDSFNYGIVREKLDDGIPFLDRIRDFLVTPFIKNLYLVRHTETYFNLENRIGGDSGLTPDGFAQARQLAEHFEPRRVPLVFTSSLKRTIQTGETIHELQSECKIVPLPEFNEIESGVCDSMTYDEIRRQMPDVANARKINKYYYVYPKGESYASMELRIERGIKKVLYFSKYSDNIVIVGHRGVNRMVLSHFLYKRKEDVPYIYMPQDKYYHLKITQNKKVFELKKFT